MTSGRHVSRIDDDGGGDDEDRGRSSPSAQLQATSHPERPQEIHLFRKVQSGWESTRVCRCVIIGNLPQVSYRLYRQAADKLIKIWDATTGDIIQTLSGHSEGISDIAWSAHSDYIASASDDKTVRIWSLDVGCVMRSLTVDPLTGIFVPGDHGEDIERAHQLCLLCELQSAVQPLGLRRVRRDSACVGRREGYCLLSLALMDRKPTVCPTGKSLKVLPAHSDPVTAVSFSHDGTLIVSCAMDGLMCVRRYIFVPKDVYSHVFTVASGMRTLVNV